MTGQRFSNRLCRRWCACSSCTCGRSGHQVAVNGGPRPCYSDRVLRIMHLTATVMQKPQHSHISWLVLAAACGKEEMRPHTQEPGTQSEQGGTTINPVRQAHARAMVRQARKPHRTALVRIAPLHLRAAVVPNDPAVSTSSDRKFFANVQMCKNL